MKKSALIFICILFCAVSFAQQADPIICPKFEIKAPINNEVAFAGKTTLFASLGKLEKSLAKNISYTWTVHNGIISDKAVGKNIQVITTGAVGQKMILVLKVIGLDESCPSSTTILLEIVPAQIRVERKIVAMPVRRN